MRSFGRLGVFLAALAVAQFVCCVGSTPAFADLISTTPVSESAASQPVADRAAVASQLENIGLSAPEAGARVASLTDDESSRLAQCPEQLQMAGNPWVIISIAVALVIIGFWFIESFNQREKNKA
ncbi:MAG: PA2779 family protein [Planctomycetes bacterium]|nr:PA2779 family protein [Planctomycetota bacterium]